MKSRIFITALLLVCLSGLAAGQPLTESLPADPVYYIGWSGKNITFEGSYLGQMVAEPGVGKMLESIKAAIDKNARGSQKDIADAVEGMLGVAWKHPFALAMTDYDKKSNGGSPQGVLLIDLGADRQAFEKDFNVIRDTYKRMPSFTEESFKGTSYYRVSLRKDGALCMGFKNNLFFAALGENVAQFVIDPSGKETLESSKNFQTAMEQVNGENLQLAYYIDVATIRTQVLPQIGANLGFGIVDEGVKADQINKVLGLEKATAAVGAVRIVDRGLYSKAMILKPDPKAGALGMLAGEPLTAEELAQLPADADFAAAGRVDAEKSYKTILASIDALDPDMRRQVEQMVANFEDQFGVSLEKDIFAGLGNVGTISSAPSQGGLLTGTVLTFQVKDEEKLQAALKKIETRAAEMLKGTERERYGRTRQWVRLKKADSDVADIRYLSMRLGGTSMPIAPAWTVHKGKFYVALWPQVVATTLANSGKSKPLTDNEQYKTAMSHLSGKGVTVTYINYASLSRNLYGALLVGGSIMGNELAKEVGIETAVEWLPTLGKLEKYLGRSVSAAYAAENGIVYESYGRCPIAALGDLYNVAMPTLIAPMIAKAQQARRVASMLYSMNSLSRGLHVYATENQGLLPTKLDRNQLQRYTYISDRMEKALRSGQIVYLGKGSLNSVKQAGKTIILYPQPPESATHVLVAYVDGSTKIIERKVFEKQLEESRKAWSGEGKSEVEDF
ncbi:MAG: DUF3352 domain-containing protein [Phycisphaerae bacterium]